MKNSITISTDSFDEAGVVLEAQAQNIHALNTNGRSSPIRNIMLLMIYLVTLFYVIIAALA